MFGLQFVDLPPDQLNQPRAAQTPVVALSRESSIAEQAETHDSDTDPSPALSPDSPRSARGNTTAASAPVSPTSPTPGFFAS